MVKYKKVNGSIQMACTFKEVSNIINQQAKDNGSSRTATFLPENMTKNLKFQRKERKSQ
jgi:hypothetical protein